MRLGYGRVPEDWHAVRDGALIELRPGGLRNLFLVHEGLGDTLLYLNLARRMPEHLAVFGIVPRSIASVPIAHTRIEDMAAFYVGEVRRKQPHGPYLLGGLCAGGVIAYEMASQLLRAGEDVELVVMIEAATPQALKRPWRIANLRIRRLTKMLADARKSDRAPIAKAFAVLGATLLKLVNSIVWEVKQRADRWWTRARFRLLHALLARKLPWPAYVHPLTALQIYEFAEARYTPKPLGRTTRVVLVRALRRSFIVSDTPYREKYADESFGWGALVPDLAVVDVDGGHSTMLEDPFVGPLAAALSPFLNHRSDASRSSPDAARSSADAARSSAESADLYAAVQEGSEIGPLGIPVTPLDIVGIDPLSGPSCTRESA